MAAVKNNSKLADQVLRYADKFHRLAGKIRRSVVGSPVVFRRAGGRRAKGLYYKNKLLGTAAVAPMIFCEAFFPRAPAVSSADAPAHRRRTFAMGFAYLHEVTSQPAYLIKNSFFG